MSRPPPAFAEAPAWQAVVNGWRPLFGSVRDLGFSFEWHDFICADPIDWARSFHPRTLELCLNLTGFASLSDGTQTRELQAQTLTFYHQGDVSLAAKREVGQRHQFITVEFAPGFLREHLDVHRGSLHPLVRAVVEGGCHQSMVAPVERLGTPLLAVVASLQRPPVFAPGQALWFRGKALELAAQLFFSPPEGELFCTRAKRAARDRVDKVRAILRERLNEPPALEELGRLVGCSPFYLSRLFSQEAGMTIQQFVRQIRLERAAELLASGDYNVTEAALEVGYNSLSHFSSAFHDTFGCCPGLYPIRTTAQPCRVKP